MRTRIALLALGLALLATTDADARRRRSLGGEKYSANGTFGLGLELGSPTGINGKYFLTDTTALNFGLGFIYDRYYYDDRDGLHLYLDHLWHPLSLTNQPAFQLPLYVGIGGRFWSFDDGRRGIDDDGYAIGVHAPIGIAFDFNNKPLDIYVQLAVVLDVFVNYYRDERLGFHIEGSFGVRYWFN
jgi:hypothetical protein